MQAEILEGKVLLLAFLSETGWGGVGDWEG